MRNLIAQTRISDSMFHVVPYEDRHAKLWDDRVATAPMATFLHTRKFLSYHGARFQDVSVILHDARKEPVGLFPAAVDPTDAKRVVSHPGITYGGLLHAGRLRGESMIRALEVLSAYYRDRGFRSLRYKVVPSIYHQKPSSDDLYALFRMGAVRYRCDLSCAVDLAEKPEWSERRRRGSKKARSQGVEIALGDRWMEPLWKVLEANLDEKHGVRPVHTLEEIRKLHRWFPEEIIFRVALRKSHVVAGAVLFLSPRVTHAQYICSNEAGREVSALDALFEECLTEAGRRGARYFNFGISTEEEGRVLNDGLYRFKAEFGGGGVLHECYEIEF